MFLQSSLSLWVILSPHILRTYLLCLQLVCHMSCRPVSSLTSAWIWIIWAPSAHCTDWMRSTVQQWPVFLHTGGYNKWIDWKERQTKQKENTKTTKFCGYDFLIMHTLQPTVGKILTILHSLCPSNTNSTSSSFPLSISAFNYIMYNSQSSVYSFRLHKYWPQSLSTHAENINTQWVFSVSEFAFESARSMCSVRGKSIYLHHKNGQCTQTDGQYRLHNAYL